VDGAGRLPAHFVEHDMTIMSRLKSATADLHRSAEASPLQSQLVKGLLPREGYVSFLGQMYLIHAAMEQAIRAHSAEHPGFAAVLRAYHWREPQVREDLDFLGADLGAITPANATTAMLADIERAAHEQPVALLGMLYVMEGSTNGSKFIAAAIRKAYELGNGPGAAYLDPHGDLQKERWSTFKRDMDGVGFDEAESVAIIDAAMGVFRSIKELSDELSEPVGV